MAGIEKKPTDLERIIGLVDIEGKVLSWDEISFWDKRISISGLAFLCLTGLLIGAIISAVAINFAVFKTPAVLLTLVVALTALAFQLFMAARDFVMAVSPEEKILSALKWNYNNLKNEPAAKGNLCLLKALIFLKVKSVDTKLIELYRKYPRVFNEENIIGNLYGLQVVLE